MPTVPLYQPGVRPRGFGGQINVRAGAGSFGAPEAEGVGALGSGIGALGQGLERKAAREDAADARRAYARYSSAARELLHDPESGFYARYGHDARNVTDEAHEALGRLESEFAGELSGRSREAYEQLVTSSRLTTLNGLARHERDQLRTGELEDLNAALETSVQDAIAGYTDPDAVRQNIIRGEGLIRSVMVAQGRGDDWYQQQVTQLRSDVHDGVLQRMMVDDATAAKAYLDEHRDEIAGDRLAKLEAAVADVGTRQSAQETTDAMFVDLGVNPAAQELTGEQQAALLAQAHSVEDPEVRDEVVRRTQARIGQYDQIWNRSQGERLDEVWETVLAGGTLDDVDPMVFGELPGSKQKEVQDYIVRRAKGDTTATDWELFNRLNEAYINDRDSFAEMNLSQYFGSLADTERRQVLSWQRSAGDKTAAAEKKAAEQRASRTHFDWLLNTEFAALGWKVTPTGADRDRAARVRAATWREVSDFQEARERAATDDEIQAIIGRMLTPGALERRWWFDQGDVTFGEVVGTEEAQRFLPSYDEIPKAEREQIESQLRARNMPVTEAEVSRLYGRWLATTVGAK